MYHVSQLLNSEEHRRLIGNDVVFIIFHEGEGAFDPTPLDGIGTVPQVFLVVKPEGDRFRLGTFTRPNIREFDPALSSLQTYTEDSIKDILLVKAFNGFAMSRLCPPMSRLFEKPRESYISDVVKEFLEIKPSKMTKQQRKKGVQNIKSDISQRNSTQIIVTCLECSELNSSNPVKCLVKIKKLILKTKASKKLSWNESLTFSSIDVDPHFSSVKIYLQEKEQLANRIIGRVETTFSSFCASLDQPLTLSVMDKTGIEVVGTIGVQMSIRGNGADLCPKCLLFLGDTDTVFFSSDRYHSTCVKCCECHKPLSDSLNDVKLVRRENKHFFYCSKDFHSCGLMDEAERDVLPQLIPGPTSIKKAEAQ
eukprot:TRINITY_DN267_c0_g2_i1.p1 TRINITY_DN267_c0_g2~~TRINITY_DN267_c0_g2_i1.p1  ORF type:complete len:365 (+),score=61.04 TRINITY_DN267_c0_g2_i1:378-1472(+)